MTSAVNTPGTAATQQGNTKTLEVAGVVLCGGKGERMGGVQKGLVDHEGRPLFSYAVDNLRTITQDIWINTNTEAEAFEKLGYDCFDDGDFSYQGPLAGILAAMRRINCRWLAIAPCDQLHLPADLYPELLAAAQLNQAAFAVSKADSHPTCAVISTDLAETLEGSLSKNERRLMGWMQTHAKPVRFDKVDFANINSPAQLQ